MGAEALKLLTMKGLNPAHESYGGAPEITWEDVARCKAKMSKAATVYADLKYLMPEHKSHLVHYLVKMLVVEHGLEDPAARRYLWVAIYEDALQGVKGCKSCEGTGKRMAGGVLKECQPCNGQGKRRMSNAERCRMLVRTSNRPIQTLTY